jgi:hypothetical protein
MELRPLYVLFYTYYDEPRSEGAMVHKSSYE